MNNTKISFSDLTKMVQVASRGLENLDSGLGEISIKLNTEKEKNAELNEHLEALKKTTSATFNLLGTRIEEISQTIESIDANNPQQKKEAQKLLAELSKIIEEGNSSQNNPSTNSSSTSSSAFPPS